MNTQPWQPIATAPKDRRILLLRNTDHISTGQYNPDKYARKPRPYWTDEYLHMATWARKYPPTHWMELPDLPEVA